MNLNPFVLSAELGELDREVMERCAGRFAEIEAVREKVETRLLRAFIKRRITAGHLTGSTGYGYGDLGRDELDALFADAVGAESALCRAQFMSGTHALTVALFGLLRSGDRLLFATGRPYDTLQPVVWGQQGSLAQFGVESEVVPLKNGRPDLDAIERAAAGKSVVYIQRSRGYDSREVLGCKDIEAIAAVVRAAEPNAVVFVDNCYGEFCESAEPVSFGADLMAGSLIKNPGGGIAETGGYIAGRADLVELCAHRLTAPGAGREIGCWPQGLRGLYLGLYLAPRAVAEAMKTGVYAACLFEKLGFEVSPRWDQPRYDITTAITLGDPERLKALCRAVQAASPIDSSATPEPWDMPGYDSKVIMAAGAFTCGSSIELSCDAPLREPYTAYLQGGLSLNYSRLALLGAAERLGRR